MAVPSASRGPPQRRVHHDTLFFPDGDIVLSAPMDPVQEDDVLVHLQQLFRVHRFILKHNSPVFSDMLALPTPQEHDVNEMYEGVPVVVMQDSASDLASLLNVLYNSTALPFKRMDPNTPLLIRGILRLAVKYAIDPLRARLLEHLASDWPRTLMEWDRLQRDVESTWQYHILAPHGVVDDLYVDDRFPEPASAIRIAQDFGCPEILPAAYYRVACTPAANDWKRMRAGHSHGGPWLSSGELTVRWELLDHTDLMRVIAGRDFLSRMFCKIVEAIREPPPGMCYAIEGQCQSVRTQLKDEILLRYHSKFDALGAINACLEREYQFQDGLRRLCSECKDNQDNAMEPLKENIWDHWPSALDLPEMAQFRNSRVSKDRHVLIDLQQLFRVHRFILKQNSPVFSDMLALPTPQEHDVNEMYEGVPVVVMQDSASDLASLLNVLYNPCTALPFKRMDPNTPFLIRGILRLAVKYAIDPLRARLLEHLAFDWPRTLVEWDRLQRDIDSTLQNHILSPYGVVDDLYVDDRFPEPASAIRIAQDFGCPEILPAAYYRVACAPAANDWKRMREGSGHSRPGLSSGEMSVRWELLDHGDLMRVLSGRDYLSQKFCGIVDSIREPPLALCCDSEIRCEHVRRQLKGQILLRYDSKFDALGAINMCLQREYQFPDGLQRLCSVCSDDQDSAMEMLKETIWRQWPSALGL
ncbi:hypothetical protein B0H21DRAFT_690608 [Amylocystis lapponica]|nr:hypothetical protein B0H21DRAFT_690608 [Amylocystis lapponica]